jgi:hypothetical protein
MEFFRTIRSGIFDPAFYRTMRERKTMSAFGYFALLILVASLVSSLKPVADIAAFVFRPSAEKDTLRGELLSLYPDGLSVRFDQGIISTNVAEPYAIPFPRALEKEIGDRSGYPKNLLVIDTAKPISASDFEAFDTIAILSKDSVGFHDAEKDKMEIQYFGRMSGESFTLDKNRFASFVEIAERFAKGFGIALLFLIPIAIFFAKLIGFLLYLVFGAFIIWVIAKLRGFPLGYGDSYKAGLYLLTLPILYGIISSAPFIPALHVPLLFTAILAIMAAVNLVPIRTLQEPVASESGSDQPTT